MTTFYSVCPGPWGDLMLTSDGEALTGLYLRPREPAAGWRREDRPLAEALRQLGAYLAGELKQFDLPMRLEGTDFQRQVWKELTRIPYGTTISYGELARRVGRPAAARAVGAANGANPVAIVVPCHRVIGSNGTLTGYGGGLDVKQWLLRHEALPDGGLFG